MLTAFFLHFAFFPNPPFLRFPLCLVSVSRPFLLIFFSYDFAFLFFFIADPRNHDQRFPPPPFPNFPWGFMRVQSPFARARPTFRPRVDACALFPGLRLFFVRTGPRSSLSGRPEWFPLSTLLFLRFQLFAPFTTSPAPDNIFSLRPPFPLLISP